jgi:hypothetical protein
MQVHNSFSPIITRRPAAMASMPTPAPSSGDSVTLSSGSETSLGNTLGWGGLSAAPFVGLAAHSTAATNLYWTDQKSAEKVAVAGAAANAVGSVALVAGAIFGSGATVAAGLGLLAASGAAGAYAYNHMS